MNTHQQVIRIFCWRCRHLHFIDMETWEASADQLLCNKCNATIIPPTEAS